MWSELHRFSQAEYGKQGYGSMEVVGPHLVCVLAQRMEDGSTAVDIDCTMWPCAGRNVWRRAAGSRPNSMRCGRGNRIFLPPRSVPSLENWPSTAMRKWRCFLFGGDMVIIDEPTFTYTRAEFEFRVHRNRVDILDTSELCTALSGGKLETILLRDVTDVAVTGLAQKLSITTSDGTTYAFNLGTRGGAARQAIVDAL